MSTTICRRCTPGTVEIWPLRYETEHSVDQSLMGAAANTVNVSVPFFLDARRNSESNAHRPLQQRDERRSAPLALRRRRSEVSRQCRQRNQSPLPLQNPTGATSVALDFRLFDATNNWWWAIDNINVFTRRGAATDGVLRAIVDRNTSNVKIVNNTGEAVSLRGYSLRSAAVRFNEPNATFLADSDPNWVQLTAPECHDRI